MKITNKHSDLSLEISETKAPTAKVNINNYENAKEYKAHLTYPAKPGEDKGETIEVALVKGEGNSYTATFSKNADIAGEYKLEIFAVVDLKDGNKEQTISLGSVTHTEEIEANIVSGSIERDQPTKGETVTITYVVHDNTGKEVEYIKVNGQYYKATRVEGMPTDLEVKYTVDVPVPINGEYVHINNETGVPYVEFIVTEIRYEGDIIKELKEKQHKLSKDVQNAKPTFENTFDKTDEAHPKMKFNFKDPNYDGVNEGTRAFRKATVKLIDENGNVVKTREYLEIGEQEFALYPEEDDDNFNKPQEGEVYSIEVEIEYDVEFQVQGKENEVDKFKENITGLQIVGDFDVLITTEQKTTKVDIFFHFWYFFQ